MMTRLLCLFYLLNVIGAFCANYEDNPSIQLFQEYIQINTTTNNDLTPAVDFWTAQAEALDLEINSYEYVEGYPVLVIKWPGSDPSLGSVMLNSHMDVVPAGADTTWTHPPFSAFLDEDGFIWGRGTQDMKSVGIQYYEALRRITENGVTLLRDVYMTLMPDEEDGGQAGMISFLQSEEFANMNVAVEMDEGSSFPQPQFPLFYRDKDVWQIQIDCYGTGGHSSSFTATNTTATGKCRRVIDSLLDFRDQQYQIAVAATVLNAGTYSSINLNIMEAGTANNVVPDHVRLVFDIRPSITVNFTDLAAQLNQYVVDAGDNVTLSYILQNQRSPGTVIDNTNPFWLAISQAAQAANITLIPVVSPGSTDARHVRSRQIPAFGFSPLHNTPLLLHSVDERVNASIFLEGIDIYEQIITNLANVEESGDTNNVAYVAL